MFYQTCYNLNFVVTEDSKDKKKTKTHTFEGVFGKYTDEGMEDFDLRFDG